MSWDLHHIFLIKIRHLSICTDLHVPKAIKNKFDCALSAGKHLLSLDYMVIIWETNTNTRKVTLTSTVIISLLFKCSRTIKLLLFVIIDHFNVYISYEWNHTCRDKNKTSLSLLNRFLFDKWNRDVNYPTNMEILICYQLLTSADFLVFR